MLTCLELKDEQECEERAEKLQVDNMTLKSHLSTTKSELAELKLKVQAKDRELLLLQDRFSQSTKEFAKKKEEVSSLRDDVIFEAKALKEARAELELIKVKKSAKNLQIELKDNGSGAPSEIIQKFGKPMSSNKEHGTGIGTYLAQR